jgi:DNA-binding GntR family transcriptional regulator
MTREAGNGVAASTLADNIAFRIETDILSGRLRPGAKLRQEELCQLYGVSRTPVREALRKLQAQKLVVMAPNRGAMVRALTRQEIIEVYDLRAELESYAAQRACERADAVFDRRLAEASRAVDSRAKPTLGRDISDQKLNAEVSESIRSFHHLIQDAAGSTRLVEMIRELETLFLGDFCSHEMAQPDVAERLHIDEHRGIMDAIRARNAAAARELMRAHIHHAKRILIQHLDEIDFWGEQAATAERNGRS